MGNIEFKQRFIENFLQKENYKIVFKMGENEDDYKRVEEVENKFRCISEYIFKNSKVWILLFIWEKDDENILVKDTGIQSASIVHKIYNDDSLLSYFPYDTEAMSEAKILLLEYDEFRYNNIENLVKLHAGYELALDNTFNISFYIISMFHQYNTLVNLYDDRGLKLLTDNHNFIRDIKESKFPYSESVISSNVPNLVID